MGGGDSRREYLTTHPRLSFAPIDLNRSPARLWMLLGEARSKIEHLGGVPLRPEAQFRMQRLYLAKGAWATTAIEGNTLSEEQVRARIEGDLRLPASQEYLGQEIDNVVVAFNLIKDDLVIGGYRPFTLSRLQGFNRLVLNNLELEPDVQPGEFRTRSVAVGPYRAAPAQDVMYLLDRLFEWLESAFQPPADDPDMALATQIVKAIVAHVYFEWIHPFGDGNGRTGRLIEFEILLAAGVPFPAAHLLSNHYNATRSEYYRQLNLTSRSGGDLISFLVYAVEGFVDGLRVTIHQVQTEQMDVMWENQVHQVLPGSSPTQERRRAVVLAMSRIDAPVTRQQLATFAPEVAAAYLGKGSKTVTRDLNELRRLGLVRSEAGGYVAAKEQMRAFLPGAVN
jgi:cell filamentation protein, protein adenylyltransferase